MSASFSFMGKFSLTTETKYCVKFSVKVLSPWFLKCTDAWQSEEKFLRANNSLLHRSGKSLKVVKINSDFMSKNFGNYTKVLGNNNDF